MSDFNGNFWHLFVAGVTLVGIVACLILLWFSGKAKAMTANDNTTGHVWDGDLREMNNPLPRWWVGLFVITVVLRWSTWPCTRALATTQANSAGPRQASTPPR